MSADPQVTAPEGGVDLRAATTADVPAAAHVWRDAWLDGHVGRVPDELLPARGPDYFREKLGALVASTVLAVDDVDGRILGLVVVAGDELFQLAVDRRASGRGVGSALLAAAEARIGAGHAQAWLAVVPDNTRARALYERRGWRDAGPFTYAAPAEGEAIPVPVLRYVKDLAPLPSS